VAVAPVIFGIQGYNASNGEHTDSSHVVAGQYLILYGNFSANQDNQVIIDGQAANETSQTQNQINVLLNGNLTSGQHTITVINPNGTSSQSSFIIVTPAPTTPTITEPVLTAAQGYDSSTGVYTNNIASSGKYLILYGNFAASGNTVLINGQSANIIAQTINQINVLLGSLSGSSIGVSVSNSGGQSQILDVAITAPTPVNPTKTAAITYDAKPRIGGLQLPLATSG